MTQGPACSTVQGRTSPFSSYSCVIPIFLPKIPLTIVPSPHHPPVADCRSQDLRPAHLSIVPKGTQLNLLRLPRAYARGYLIPPPSAAWTLALLSARSS